VGTPVRRGGRANGRRPDATPCAESTRCRRCTRTGRPSRATAVPSPVPSRRTRLWKPRADARPGSLRYAPKDAGRTVKRMELSAVSQLLDEPARTAMLDALLSGQALAAGELARVAGVSAPTASEHLTRLRENRLVERVVARRHRYYHLASAEIG